MIYITAQNKKVPVLGYGTWQLRGDACRASVAKALEIGYRHIDTAQIYENEAEVGAAIQESGVKREDIFLTTKIWISEIKNGLLQRSVDISLERLKTDHVDLLLVHWPVDTMPFYEQMRALVKLRDAGKTKLIGVSNFTLAQMKEVVEKIAAPIVTNQVEFHPYLSQKPMLDYVRAHNLFLTAYCPLARGRVDNDPVIVNIARKYNKTPGQVALRWLVMQKGVAAIPKAASEKHMRENFDIFNFALNAAELNEITALARPDGRIVNPDISPVWDKTG
jgi:2,5-diketo-D-gluconate reductase B